MVVVPLAASPNDTESSPSKPKIDSRMWVRVAAAGSLAAGGVLLMSGKRRAGLVAAVAGTALTCIDQQETVSEWWNRLPGYIAEVQSILTRVQGAVDELASQGERIRSILCK